MSEYRSTSQTVDDSAKKSIKAGVRLGEQTAKKISQAKKAAGKIKKPASAIAQIRKAKYIAIAVAAALFSIILICAFYAGPMAIFERLQGFSDRIKEVYESELYSADIENGWQQIIASVKALIKGVSEAINEIWNAISNQTDNGNGTFDKDIADDDDLLVMGSTEAMKNEYQKKVDAVIDKYNARAKSLQDSVNAQHTALSGYVGSVCFPRDRSTFMNEETEYESKWNNVHPVYKDGQLFYEGYEASEDMFQIEYGGLNLNWNMPKMSANTAVELIALCTVQFDNSADNIKPSQLMKWMGYYGGSGDGPQIESIGGSGISTPPLAKLNGCFMPQYLVDEMVQNPERDYSSYMAPAVDALIEFRAPQLSGLSPHIEDVETSALVYYTHPERYFTGQYQTKQIQTYKYRYGWYYEDTGIACPQSYVPAIYQNITPAVGTRAASRDNRRIIYKQAASIGYENVVDYNSPIYGWRQTTYSTYEVKKIKIITYTATFSISCRKPKILSDMANFYDGEKEIMSQQGSPVSEDKPAEVQDAA